MEKVFILIGGFLFDFISDLIFFILHVTGSGSFPKPLSAKEEKEYLEKLNQGDQNARNMLIEHNLRLVAHIIKKYYANSSDQDDLISIGTIGLIKAIDSFDTGKGIRLSSYAARCIENEILMFFRTTKKTAQDVSMNEPIDTDRDGNALTLMDTMASEDNMVENIKVTTVKIEKLKSYMEEELLPREQSIICLRYGLVPGSKPLAQREVASALGISRSYVSRIEKKALSTLNKRFSK